MVQVGGSQLKEFCFINVLLVIILIDNEVPTVFDTFQFPHKPLSFEAFHYFDTNSFLGSFEFWVEFFVCVKFVHVSLIVFVRFWFIVWALEGAVAVLAAFLASALDQIGIKVLAVLASLCSDPRVED